jgi:DNA-binding transcriptional LysR family regulator
VECQPREGIRASLLAPAEYVCILPPGHPLAAKAVIQASDLAGEPFIGPMHETDAVRDDVDRVLLSERVTVERLIETQHSYPAYCYVAAGLGVAIAEPFSAPLFARLGVAVRRFRPAVRANFTVLEPVSIGPTPAAVARFRDIVVETTRDHLAQVEAMISAPQPA